jgi:hypothetical protein
MKRGGVESWKREGTDRKGKDFLVGGRLGGKYCWKKGKSGLDVV